MANLLTVKNYDKNSLQLEKKETTFKSQGGEGKSVSLHTQYIKGSDVKNFYLTLRYVRLGQVRKGEWDSEETNSALLSFPDEWETTHPETKEDAAFLQGLLYQNISEKFENHKSAFLPVCKSIMKFSKNTPEQFINPIIKRGDKKDGSGQTDLGMFVSVNLQNIPKRDATGKAIPGEFLTYGKTGFAHVKTKQTIPLEILQVATLEGVAKVWFKVKFNPKKDRFNIHAQLLEFDAVNVIRVKNDGKEKELEAAYEQHATEADAGALALANDFADIKVGSGKSLTEQLMTPTEQRAAPLQLNGINLNGLAPQGESPAILFSS